MEAKIINVAPDGRSGPIWELKRRDRPDLPWQDDGSGDSNGSPEKLRRLAETERRALIVDESA